MRVAIDKTIVKKIKDFDEFEYIYIFDDEDIKNLLKLNLHCINKKYLEGKEVEINLTNYGIECLKKTNLKDKNWKIIPKIKDNKIGIIIPNYNYEHTIDTCLTSILNQTYKNYEVIFIDDMSTDKSIEIAEKYKNKMNIKIIKLKQKRLNGGARNEAYLHLSKDVDYVYYIDSDDWLYDNKALEKINKSLRKNPDVLFVGIAYYKDGKTINCYVPNYKDKYEAIKSWSGSCGKVIKKNLATKQECLYPEGTLKEDRTQHRKICIYMNSFENLSDMIYVWNRENAKSVTTIREKTIWGTSTIRHYADTIQLYLSVKGKDKKIDEILENAIKQTKSEIDLGGDRQW